MSDMISFLFVIVGISITSAQDECWLKQTDLRNGDLYGINKVQTVDACKDICMADWKCKAFTWATWKRCYIKSDKHRDPSKHNNAISGKAACFTDDPRWKPSEFTNVALRENVVAKSSGDRHGGKATRAVDNSTVTYWDGKSCSYSNRDKNLGWWELDLDKTYTIDHIMIYSRSDMEQNWLNGAKVLVGNQLCQTLSKMEENPTKGHKIDCDGRKLVGKKIRIEKIDTYIVLCEVQVMVENPNESESPATPSPNEIVGEPIDDHFNVAYNKPVRQSTSYSDYKADTAVDGFVNQIAWKKTCFISNRKGGVEFWEVDLGRNYQIDEIKIFTRTDCCTNRDLGVKVYVGENRCGIISEDHKNNAVPHIVQCEKALMAGSKVRVEKLYDYLQLCEVQVLVKKEDIDKVPDVTVWPGELVGDFTNVAVEKIATQSGTEHGGVASRGADGYDSGNWHMASCTHTNRGGVSYWEVDLGKVYNIDHIVIHGRTDCCEERLNSARVIVGKRIAGYLSWPRGHKKPVTLKNENGMIGRTVRIEKVNEYLTVCEVKVMVKNEDLFEEAATEVERFENVAYQKPTSQSSEKHGGASSRAVDNYPDKTKWSEGSCTHTDNNQFNWWSVDLQKDYYIDRIIISGRADCCHDYLTYATVAVDGRTIGNLGSESGLKWTFNLGGLKGRNVTVQRRSGHKHPLMLCEVEVIVDNEYEPDESNVEPIDSDDKNIALESEASSLTSMFGGTADKINDGNVNGDFFAGSCYFSAPQQGSNMVKLATKGPIGSVSVYPRTDAYMMETIDGALVRAGDKLCGEIKYAAGKMFYTVDCGNAEGPVTVSKLGWLSVCEVVVHSS